jgi:hypothetical protein
VRWITEDARKYVAREVRRGSRYDGIVLDPPKYGRGPDGEVWRLFEDLPELAGLCAELLSENAKFLVLNAYAERISGAALSGLLADKLQGRGGRIEWGELALVQQDGAREIGMSFFARWSKEHGVTAARHPLTNPRSRPSAPCNAQGPRRDRLFVAEAEGMDGSRRACADDPDAWAGRRASLTKAVAATLAARAGDRGDAGDPRRLPPRQSAGRGGRVRQAFSALET